MPSPLTWLPALGIALLALSAVVWLHESGHVHRLTAEVRRRFLSLPPLGRLLAVVFLGTFILRGSTKPPAPQIATLPTPNLLLPAFTLTPLPAESGPLLLEGSEPSARRLSTNQYLAGFALVRAVTNAAPWLVTPANTALHTPWTRYGVAEDTFWLPATNWSFTLGTNAVEGLHVSSSGTLSFGWPKGSPRAMVMPDDSTLDFLAPLQTSLGIAPPAGRFWHAPTSSNSLLLTWQDVYANRDTNYPASFQAELAWNGDFTYRYAFARPPALTNFAIGAQHNGGGETYALSDTNRLAHGLELRWRAFGLLDPDIEDHDDDGLSTYDEVMLHGTDPRLPDSDRDGIADAEELASGTSPTDPDSDHDGFADDGDPAPLVSLSPDADPDGDGLSNLTEYLNGLDPQVNDALDTDEDGWPDWKERLAGTDTNAWWRHPGLPDPATLLFDATFTLAQSLPYPAVFEIAGSKLVLQQARTFTLTLFTDAGYDVVYHPTGPAALDLSVLFTSPRVGLHDPSGLFAGAHQAGTDVREAFFGIPTLGILPARICFHDPDAMPVFAVVSPPFYGVYDWSWPSGDITSTTEAAPWITWTDPPGQSGISLSFLPEGATEAAVAWHAVTRCARTDDDGPWTGCTCAWGPGEPELCTEPDSPETTNAVGRGLLLSVNNDDDDANAEPDLWQAPSGDRENDLRPVLPLGRYDGTCCPCPEHALLHTAQADLESCSPRLALYADPGKTNELGGTIQAGQFAYVEGLEASTEVGGERVVWSWTDDQQATHLLTNTFTVASVRLFGDLDLDGDVDDTDLSLHAGLSREHGWLLPASSNTLRRLRLRTDVRLPGHLILSLTAPAGACRLWTTPTPGPNDTPLLLPGQTVTNGLNGANFAAFGDSDVWVEVLAPGVAVARYIYTGTGVADGVTSAASMANTLLKVDLDIRETAQPQNRVGRDDPRILARVRNRILVWANSGANTVTFDLIKPPGITSPVWIQVEDQTGLNSGMPRFERLDATSKTFTYTVADDNDNADLLVRYGADLNSDGTLSGTDEIKGTYEVYGVTAEDYAESRNNYNWFYLPGALYDLADQLHKRFANGAFGSGDFQPTTTSGSASLSATRLTHYFGANLTDAGFVTLGGRQYYAATATFPIYHYADNSDASELIRKSSELKDGLDAFVASLSHATVAAAYAAAPGGTTRSVTFSLDGRTFQFGATERIGLGGVGVSSAEPYSSAGTVALQITLNGSNYEIGAAATTDLTLHDIFDFDYFTTGWIANYSDSSRSAAMIQNGFGKTGSVTNAGQVGLVEVEVDGSVSITGRTVTP